MWIFRENFLEIWAERLSAGAKSGIIAGRINGSVVFPQHFRSLRWGRSGLGGDMVVTW